MHQIPKERRKLQRTLSNYFGVSGSPDKGPSDKPNQKSGDKQSRSGFKEPKFTDKVRKVSKAEEKGDAEPDRGKMDKTRDEGSKKKKQRHNEEIAEHSSIMEASSSAKLAKEKTSPAPVAGPSTSTFARGSSEGVKGPRQPDDHSSKSSKAKHSKSKGERIPPENTINIDSTSSSSDFEVIRLAPRSSQPIPPMSSDVETDSDNGGLQSPVNRKKVRATQVLSDIEMSSWGSDDELLGLSAPRKVLGKRKTRLSSPSASELDKSDEESDEPPIKRVRLGGGLKRGLKPMPEEMEVMDDELDEDVVIEQRLRKPKKSAFSKALEKRRRQRQGLPDLSSSDEESSKPSIIELLSDEDEEEEAAFVPIPGSKRPDGSSPTVNKKGKTKANISSHSSSEGEEQEDDIEKFIVNDEEIEGDATGGGHGMMLPVNFSIRGAQPLAHSFKVFFQLLVHVAYQPENVRKEYMKARLEGDNDLSCYFAQATYHLRRHLSSIRDSQVASTIWLRRFRKRLEEFPKLDIMHIEMVQYCDACRRNAAISTRMAILRGERYDMWGFRPLKGGSNGGESGSDEESGNGSDTSSKSDAEEIVATDEDSDEREDEETITYNLGQHCARRVALFHEFAHWEYHLFQQVNENIDELITQDRELAQKRANKTKEGKKVKEMKKRMVDLDDPDSVVDWLEKKGVVGAQWGVVQEMIEKAKTVEMRKPGEID